MITIKGEYENGQVKLLEQVPFKKRNKVLITFLDEEEDEEESLRNLSLKAPNALESYLYDEREDLYQEYLNPGK
jgi:predicted DNA-binding antitoxin AbrB/MazE fold protein